MNRALELAAAGARYVAIAEVLVAEGFPARNSRSLGQRLRKLGYGRGWGRYQDLAGLSSQLQSVVGAHRVMSQLTECPVCRGSRRRGTDAVTAAGSCREWTFVAVRRATNRKVEYSLMLKDKTGKCHP